MGDKASFWKTLLVLFNVIQFVCNDTIRPRRNSRREDKGLFEESDSIDPHKPSGLEILVSTSFSNQHSINSSATEVQNQTPKDVRFPSNPNTYLLMSTVGHQHKPFSSANSISIQRSTNRPQSHYSTNYKSVVQERPKHILLPSEYPTTQASTSTKFNKPSIVFNDVIHTVGSFFRAIQTFPSFITGQEGGANVHSYPDSQQSEDEDAIYTPSIYSDSAVAGYLPPDSQSTNGEENSSQYIPHKGHDTSTGQKWNPAWATLGDVCIN